MNSTNGIDLARCRRVLQRSVEHEVVGIARRVDRFGRRLAVGVAPERCRAPHAGHQLVEYCGQLAACRGDAFVEQALDAGHGTRQEAQELGHGVRQRFMRAQDVGPGEDEPEPLEDLGEDHLHLGEEHLDQIEGLLDELDQRY